MQIKYQTIEYSLDYLLKMAKGNNWAARELRLNGYADEIPADHGESMRRV